MCHHPTPAKMSSYIEPVDETALADDVPAEEVLVVLVALTVVAIPIVVDVPTLFVVAVDLTFESVNANVGACRSCDVSALPS